MFSIQSIVVFSLLFIFVLYVGYLFVVIFCNYLDRKKFISLYTKRASKDKGNITFKEAQTLAISAKLTNFQATIAIDELLTKILTEKKLTLSSGNLDKIKNDFIEESQFENIPSSIYSYLQNLQQLLDEKPDEAIENSTKSEGKNSNLVHLKYELEKNAIETSKKITRSKIYTFIGLIGTLFTILGYFDITTKLIG